MLLHYTPQPEGVAQNKNTAEFAFFLLVCTYAILTFN